MKTFCVGLGLIVGFLVGSLWNSAAQPPAIAQTVRPDGAGAAAGDLCDGRWEVDTTFNAAYRYRCNGTLVPALSAPVYLASPFAQSLAVVRSNSTSFPPGTPRLAPVRHKTFSFTSPGGEAVQLSRYSPRLRRALKPMRAGSATVGLLWSSGTLAVVGRARRSR